jgi:hypothetical protein
MPTQGRNYCRGVGVTPPRLYLVGYIHAISSGKLKKKFKCLGLERNSCRKTFDKFTKILLKNAKQAPPPPAATSFPEFRMRTKGREEKALVWAGHVIWAYLTATRQVVAKYS